MKDNVREPNFSKNDYINESEQKNKIQTSSNKVAYQKLFTENSFDKKLKAKKCILNKKSLIISIIIITIILLIFFIFVTIYFFPIKNVGNIGFSTGGAKDTNNFRENIKNGYFPISTDITYNGLFYDYYFDTGKKTQSEHLFSPSYSCANSKDPISSKNEYYITVGQNSNIKETDFQRKKLNLVIVLDISGSMFSIFSSYYYDGLLNDKKNISKSDDDNKTKMEISKESLNILIDHLKSDDKLGIVLFNEEAEILNKIEKISKMNIKKTKKSISKIKADGGTNMEAGYSTAIQLLKECKNSDKSEYENRIIFITDAMPNTGITSTNDLLFMIKDNADKGIYTTFIGVGVDFNSKLIEDISDVKGANYYSVHNAKEFKERMGEQFDYMVTPLVFDLSLNLKSNDFNVEMVYGSDSSNNQKENLMKVNTLFPTKTTEEGEVKGGVVLVKLKSKSENIGGKIDLEVSYKDRNGKEYNNSQTIYFGQNKNGNEEFYDNSGIRKAIALTRYVNILKNWILYERTGNKIFMLGPTEGIIDIFYTEEETTKLLGEHERMSVQLKVSQEYKEIFRHLKEYILKENQEIKDDILNKEIEILEMLITKE